jgi:hypothetical protein
MTEVIKGQVSGMQVRLEQALRKSWGVWAFRVERKDADGKPLPRVPVEMRARRFDGSINNGDWVEITAKWRRGKLLHPRQVRNLSTGVTVKARGLTRGQWIVIEVVTPVLMLAILIFVALVFWPRWKSIFGTRPKPVDIKINTPKK